MSMSFTGPKGWVEQRWIVYALLRDNVQHHLESGSPSTDFEALHSLGRVLGGVHVSVPAARLHAELLRAKQELCSRPIDDLAISLRTRSVLALTWPPPHGPATALVKDGGGSIPMIGGAARSLDDVFGHLIDALLRVTEGASNEDTVEVDDL